MHDSIICRKRTHKDRNVRNEILKTRRKKLKVDLDARFEGGKVQIEKEGNKEGNETTNANSSCTSILSEKKNLSSRPSSEDLTRKVGENLRFNDRNNLDDLHHEKSKNSPPHKCLIFAQHRQTLDIIENCVLLRYFPTINYKKLDGSVPPIVRAQWAQKFNQADVEENFQKNVVAKKKEKLKSIFVDCNVECIDGKIAKEKIKIRNQIGNKNYR